MKKWNIVLALGIFGLLMAGALNGFAQSEDPPLTWKGQGKAWIVGDEGVSDIDFSSMIHIDENNLVKGTFTGGDGGTSDVERLFYALPENGIRKLVMVVVDHESDNPVLVVLKANMLGRSLIYGEVWVKGFEKEGEYEKALGIGNQEAQEIYPDSPPQFLKDVAKSCRLLGCFMIKGNYE